MNHSTTICSLPSDERRSREEEAYRLSGLHAIEAWLAEARAGALTLDEPILAYFIDMALAEARTKVDLPPKGASEKRPNAIKSVVRLMD